jgi:hypothetical protein
MQYKKEIIATMEQAIHYAKLTNNTDDYLTCLYDIAQVRLILTSGKRFSNISQFRPLFHSMNMKKLKSIS